MNTNFSFRDIIVKNTGYQMVAQILTLAAGLITNAILSRYLGIERFGEFAYVFAFFYLFMAINDLGIHTIVVREMSQQKEKMGEIFGAILLFKIALAIGSLGVSWCVILSMDYNLELKNALMAYSLILPIIAFQLPIVIFHVHLDIKKLAYIGLLNRMIQFAVILVMVSLERGVAAIVAACVSSEVVTALLYWYFALKIQKPVFNRPLKWIKLVLTPSLFLGLASMFAALINRLDFIMLERMAGLKDVGLYSAAYRITNLLEALPLMVMATAFPLMSRLARQEPERLKRFYYKLLTGFSLFAIPMSLAVIFFAPLIIRVIFGADFSHAAHGLSTLIWATVFLYISISGGNLLISLGKEKINLCAQSAAVVINVILNIILIPKMGYLGATQATAISFFFVMVVTLISATYYLNHPPKLEMVEVASEC